MTPPSGRQPSRLTGSLKDRLIKEGLQRRVERAHAGSSSARTSEPAGSPSPRSDASLDEWCRFDTHPSYQQLQITRVAAGQLGLADPFFRVHDGIAGATTTIGGKPYVNFSSYNYLGLNGHPRVAEAARRAVDRYGTSASASRLVAGERPIHRELEHALAEAYRVHDAVVFVSGHATNVSTIGHLFGPKDLVLHDSLIHNSVLQGIELSGAQRLAFAHDDPEALDALLHRHRRQAERVLIVIEGIYSMDGDIPNVPAFIEIKRRHRALLMVDEAHSFGVLGATGLGIREHFGLDGSDVDIWMGTLSKSFASCGGFIAGDRALVEQLKCAAPGFVYSVGMSPPLAAAALEALRVMQDEPARVRTLHERGAHFLSVAKAKRLDTGTSAGFSVVPVITGSSIKAAQLSDALFARGINVQPILYPAVTERAARLRFFLTCDHTNDQIRTTIDATAAALGQR